MKYVFLALFVVMLIASGVTALMMPEQQTDRPILYWVSDPSPARIKQIDLFHRWMVEQGHTTPDGRSAVELRLDTSNPDATKKIIQSVSGVGGDLQDVLGGGEMRYFQQIGVLEDITDDALAMGFDPGQTYPAAHDDFTVDGRQYSFPCNLTAYGYWVNVETFERAGLSPPSYRWTFDDFERIGKELCRRANQGRKRRQVFLFGQARDSFFVLLRGTGLDRFNETMTASSLNDPRYSGLMKRIRQWTYVDHILPTPEDQDPFATQQAGYGTHLLQMFVHGNFAMTMGGRYTLIQLREINDERQKRGLGRLKLAVVEPPNDGFPNTSIATRSATVYVGSDHKQYAKLFLQFLASDTYNHQVMEEGDSLPPKMDYARREEFLRPPKYPDEWGLHERWARLMREIAIAESYSPFLPDRIANRIQYEFREHFDADRMTAEEAARRTAQRMDEEVRRYVAGSDDPVLQQRYAKALADQQRIERLRANGEMVPLELITNPFHRRLYVVKGWAK